LRLSSEEAWVKLYRPDPHGVDCQVSYYLKGAVLALVLDLHLRRQGSALALVLRDLWRSHGVIERGYREPDLLAAFVAHAADLSTLLPIWLESEEDPPLDSYLQDVGLVLSAETSPHPNPGWQLEGEAPILARVARAGAAEGAGLQVGDELLALERHRLRSPEDVRRQLLAHGCAAEITVLYSRDGLVRQTQLACEPPAIERWRLSIDPAASAGTVEARSRWLSLLP
jgi:predicted metalloprotease with PDZ domain